MSELPPLPMQDLSRDNLYGYTADQMRAYAEAYAAAKVAEERGRCANDEAYLVAAVRNLMTNMNDDKRRDLKEDLGQGFCRYCWSDARFSCFCMHDE